MKERKRKVCFIVFCFGPRFSALFAASRQLTWLKRHTLLIQRDSLPFHCLVQVLLTYRLTFYEYFTTRLLSKSVRANTAVVGCVRARCLTVRPRASCSLSYTYARQWPNTCLYPSRARCSSFCLDVVSASSVSVRQTNNTSCERFCVLLTCMTIWQVRQ